MHESLTLQQLELLVALRTTQNLGRAAAMVAISASAASHRLKEAERRLGIDLVVAHGRTIRLTAAGLHLAEVAAAASATLRAAEDTARWMSAADRPSVRLALDFYDTAPWFEPLTARADLPADVDFVRVGHQGAPAAVADGRVDIGVSVVPDHAPAGDVLVDDTLVAVVRADHPAAERGELLPDDIAAATYATAGDRPEPGFEYERFLQPAGVRPRSLRKVESLAMILRLLRRYGGITTQPSRVLTPAVVEGLAVVPLAGATIPVRWELHVAPGATDHTEGTVEVIRRLVGANGANPPPEAERMDARDDNEGER